MSDVQTRRDGMSTQRTRILDAATELFLKEGFDRVSVEKIATLAHVSKSAIYNQFGGKEPLFDAVIGYSCENVGAPDLEPFGEDFDLHEVLVNAGRTAAYRILQPKAMRIIRLALGSYHINPKLCKIFWEYGPARAAHHVSEALARVKKKRKLRRLDPHQLAIDFSNEIVGSFLFTSMLGVTPFPSHKEIDAVVDRVTVSFLTRHGLA